LNDILKQRLVGALVLIALGVVFWPVVFVDSSRDELDRASQVPPVPLLGEVAIEAPRPVEDVEPVTVLEELELHDAPPQAQADEIEVAIPATPAKPSLDERGIPVAWVLQVVSVSKKDKADALTEELVELGYKAYNKPLRRDGDALYRIYIGPVFERETLLQTKKDVDQRLRVKSIITRYVP
jgi:DedD protein